MHFQYITLYSTIYGYQNLNPSNGRPWDYPHEIPHKPLHFAPLPDQTIEEVAPFTRVKAKLGGEEDTTQRHFRRHGRKGTAEHIP